MISLSVLISSGGVGKIGQFRGINKNSNLIAQLNKGNNVIENCPLYNFIVENFLILVILIKLSVKY